MADSQSPHRRDRKGLRERSARDRLFRFQWRYLRGLLVIVVIALAAKAISQAYFRIEGWLDPLFASFDSSAPSATVTVAILIIAPWAIGWLTERLLLGRLFQRQRGMQAFRQMEDRLATELRPDDVRGYRVALINFPSAAVRTFGVIAATYPEPETGRELAALYLPGTPDPTKGSMRVVAVDDLTLTDWGLSDLARFHLSFGSASPTWLTVEEADGPADSLRQK